MMTNEAPPTHVVAMHGWASDARCWTPWIAATKDQGWVWNCGERGYGQLAPHQASWPNEVPSVCRRLVIAHSLGIHLLPPEVLPSADMVVLLASFAAFVPPDRAGRRVRAALQGMAAKLGSQDEAARMLDKFLANAASPEPAGLMPPGPLDSQLNLERLREDLGVLSECRGLPERFPPTARVLIFEAGEDRIVEPAAQAMLRETLPAADLVRLPLAGHALLRTDVIFQAIGWVNAHR